MNTAGDAADQVVRYSLEAGEVALKLTGEGAKELAVLLYTILKDDTKKTGRAKLETLIRSEKPLTIFSVKNENMKKFEKEAKRYGIMYYPIPNSEKDGLYDIMVKEEDAPRINRLVERFKLTSVTEATDIKNEIEKTREEKVENVTDKKVPEQERPGKSDGDKYMDEVLEKPMKKEEKTMSNPSSAKTEKSRLSEPISEKQSRTVEGTSKKVIGGVPKRQSVKEELQKIKSAREKEGISAKPVKEKSNDSTKNQRNFQQSYPKARKKRKER